MKKQIIGLAAILVVILLVIYGAKKIPGLGIKAEKVPEEKTGTLEGADGVFEAGRGEFLACL